MKGLKSLLSLYLSFLFVIFLSSFVVAAPGDFIDSGQSLGSLSSYGVALGDLDGDGDLDAFVANSGIYGDQNKVWLNDGTGTFTDSGQSLGNTHSADVALGDLDGDGDLDAFVTNWSDPNKVWLNDGTGDFTDSGQSLGSSDSWGVALGDLDGDGDLDAFVANSYGEPNKVWLNDTHYVEISPGTGKYGTTQSFDLLIIVRVVTGVTVTGGQATLDNQDVTNALSGCLIAGTLTSGGYTFRCPSITGRGLGEGLHTLEISIDLSNGRTVTDKVKWEVLGNTEP